MRGSRRGLPKRPVGEAREAVARPDPGRGRGHREEIKDQEILQKKNG